MTVVGYASTTSIVPGGSIDFHLSADPPGMTSLTIERVGTPAVSQALPPAALFTRVQPMNAWEGFGWQFAADGSHVADAAFQVPPAWPTGVYRLRDDSDQTDVLSFVVRSAVPGNTSKVLLHVACLTREAYNPAGGKSLYGFNSGGEGSRASKVSLDRPRAGSGYYPPGLGPEEQLIDWLENEGVALEYCSSIDLHENESLLASYECLVLAYHDEYWTKPMRDHAERFVTNGGNMIVLSGNTCYRAVRLEHGNRVVVFHKYAANDDPAVPDDEVTVAWADPPVNRPQNTLIGAGWTEGAFGGPATAYTIRFPTHWVFSGLPNPASTSAFMSYETDAAAYVDEPEGYPRVTGEEGTPLCFTVLASADLRSWGGKPGRATMGIYSRNGTVFNASTTEWCSALGADPVLAQITRNVFSRLKQRSPWDWEHIGHANFGRALASHGGKLFIATDRNRLWRRYPVGADVVWRDIGHANNVIAMAGSGDTLFCVTGDNKLWWRTPIEENTNWTAIGAGPTALGTKALAAAGGMLYAADSTGKVWFASATRTPPQWEELTYDDGSRPQPAFPSDPTIKAMTSYGNILLASTTDNRLLRTNRDWINDSSAWELIHHCNFSTGLAVVDWMLYVATTENRLWRIDLYGLRKP